MRDTCTCDLCRLRDEVEPAILAALRAMAPYAMAPDHLLAMVQTVAADLLDQWLADGGDDPAEVEGNPLDILGPPEWWGDLATDAYTQAHLN